MWTTLNPSGPTPIYSSMYSRPALLLETHFSLRLVLSLSVTFLMCRCLMPWDLPNHGISWPLHTRLHFNNFMWWLLGDYLPHAWFQQLPLTMDEDSQTGLSMYPSKLESKYNRDYSDKFDLSFELWSLSLVNHVFKDFSLLFLF